MGGQELEPFDQADAVAVEVLTQIETVEFFLLADPVKIDVIDRQPSTVLVDKRKSRTAHPGVGSYFDPLREAAHKAGLARP